MQKEHNRFDEVLTALHNCMEACNRCYDACLQEEHVGNMVECIRLDRECADICGFLEQSITRNSPYIQELASVCVTACEECADTCENHPHDHCQQCAKACRACAEACKALVS
ncbi:four-helix bundle copper-binding protein [Pontibacillus salicampi]|uniref:Four-helix bundle copper-binding protein n=1 Tax=Pontibacillus salicampi TaxID=1449801 RepID=A0ABV6LPT1_9BACI